jgi:FKBP-type peptidyl-prolyl cis-trans isomerase 2
MADNSGKMVTVSYVGRLDSGWQFMATPPESPIRFPCEAGWMPPEFVEAVRTMEVGETRIAHVGPGAAYRERSEERIVRVPRANLAADTALKPGDMATLQDATGKEIPARLVSMDDAEAVFDANDDAVGQGMHFEITLLDVQDLP